MNDKFDELAKALAQPVARRAALKRFGVGAAVALLASFGLVPRAEAGSPGVGIGKSCSNSTPCKEGLFCVRGVCSTGFPGSPCDTAADCVARSYCTQGGVCMLRCGSDWDCPRGYVCNRGGVVSFCQRKWNQVGR